MKPETVQLTTYGHENPPVPYGGSVHPRPQFRRDRFMNLNGVWDFEAGSYKGTVKVPYPVEASLSGVGRHFPEGTPLKYSRQLPEIQYGADDVVLLHIDAVDQEADIYVNDVKAAHIHTFQGRAGIDITQFLSGENTLTITAFDDLNSKDFPYGKQTLKRGGMWYTPFSGIWQSVWIEVVPAEHISSLKIDTDLTAAEIEIDGPPCGTVVFEGREIPYSNGHVTLAPLEIICWTPDSPKLYEFTVRAGRDEVHSYFALRTISVQGKSICLNGRPFFFHGLLDQGYWPEGICTPPDPECFAEDIKAMKRLGFNTLRKHIKVEHEQFYYECDRLGMIVFQDMVNNGEYSFFRDTALPTIGIKKLNDNHLNKDAENRRMFLESMRNTVEMLYNHPSICGWTIFNEGWGQFNADKTYELLKELDNKRIIDTASGWFRPDRSDVLSEHVYFKKFSMPASEKPVLLSEFGGYSYKAEGHCFNLSKTYGYRFFKDQGQFMDALEKLYTDEIIPAAQAGLAGAIYTQVSDVEDETNGLLTYDRALCKADEARMQIIAEKLTYTGGKNV